MTPDQVKLVQLSFSKVAPISEQAAMQFYDRLFEIVPQVKSMFPADMTEQRKKLMTMLAAVVKGLGNLESILPVASALATRHVSYGAKAEHYPVVGDSLAVDARKGTRRWLDTRGRERMDHGLRDAFRLHDFQSIRQPSGGRVKDTP